MRSVATLMCPRSTALEAREREGPARPAAWGAHGAGAPERRQLDRRRVAGLGEYPHRAPEPLQLRGRAGDLMREVGRVDGDLDAMVLAQHRAEREDLHVEGHRS